MNLRGDELANQQLAQVFSAFLSLIAWMVGFMTQRKRECAQTGRLFTKFILNTFV